MIKRKHLSLLVLITATFSLTSCINIIERIKFHSNGNGTYAMIVNMKPLKDMMKAMGMEDNEATQTQALDEMNSDFEQKKQELESINGVSNARCEVDKENYVITLSFDFASIESLNDGINMLYYDEKKGIELENHKYFSRDGKSLIRNDVTQISQSMNDLLNIGDTGFNGMMKDIYYRTIFEFENKINAVSNDSYELSDDGKSVSWTKYLFKEEDKDKKIGVTIKTGR